jgi:hypothetical protein
MKQNVCKMLVLAMIATTAIMQAKAAVSSKRNGELLWFKSFSITSRSTS